MESGGRGIERLAGMESIQESQWVQVGRSEGPEADSTTFSCFVMGSMDARKRDLSARTHEKRRLERSSNGLHLMLLQKTENIAAHG